MLGDFINGDAVPKAMDWDRLEILVPLLIAGLKHPSIIESVTLAMISTILVSLLFSIIGLQLFNSSAIASEVCSITGSKSKFKETASSQVVEVIIFVYKVTTSILSVSASACFKLDRIILTIRFFLSPRGMSSKIGFSKSTCFTDC